MTSQLNALDTTVDVGRFGHHPDPATDYEVEVDAIAGLIADAEAGIGNWPLVHERIGRALDFQVGGVPSSARARQNLLELALRARPKLTEPPAYRLVGTRREADALAVHLSRIPVQVLNIEGFRVTVEELLGLVNHAVAKWPEKTHA